MEGFEVDRIVFDRSVWSVYFPSVIKRSDENKYSPALIDRLDLDRELKVSQWKGKGTEKVLFYICGVEGEKPYLKVEMRLRHTRSMRVVFNFNRYFYQKFNLEHELRCPVIHDNNFLPLDSKITTKDYLEVFFKILPVELEQLYREKYAMLWPEDYARIEQKDEQLVVRCVTLELDRELYPLSVDDIHSELAAKGKAMKKYDTPFKSFNSQSRTMYFGNAPETEYEFYEDDAVLTANLDVWNWKEPYEHKKQAKLYQKSFGLVRFEATLHDDQISFNSENPEEDLRFILDDYAFSCGLIWKPTQKTYEEMEFFVANAFNVSVHTIRSMMVRDWTWKGNVTNEGMTRKLLRRGIIIRVGRGQYIANPLLKKMFDGCVIGKKKHEGFIPKFL